MPAREREKTKEAEERAEKTRQLLAESQEALFNSQEETDAAKERLAGLENELRRARQQSAQNEHLEREAEAAATRAATKRAGGEAERWWQPVADARASGSATGCART